MQINITWIADFLQNVPEVAAHIISWCIQVSNTYLLKMYFSVSQVQLVVLAVSPSSSQPPLFPFLPFSLIGAVTVTLADWHLWKRLRPGLINTNVFLAWCGPSPCHAMWPFVFLRGETPQRILGTKGSESCNMMTRIREIKNLKASDCVVVLFCICGMNVKPRRSDWCVGNRQFLTVCCDKARKHHWTVWHVFVCVLCDKNLVPHTGIIKHEREAQAWKRGGVHAVPTLHYKPSSSISFSDINVNVVF